MWGQNLEERKRTWLGGQEGMETLLHIFRHNQVPTQRLCLQTEAPKAS